MDGHGFGKELRRLRKEKKLTVRTLAELAKVSQSYITNIENGKRGIPSPEILQKLSKPLGVPYLELMRIAGHVQIEEINKKWTGAVQAASMQNFLDKAERLLIGENGSLRPEVKRALEEYLGDASEVSGVNADNFLDTMKNVLEDLTEKIRRGEDVDAFLQQHAHILRAQNFLFKRFLAENTEATPASINTTEPPYYELTEILKSSSPVPVRLNNQLLTVDDRQRILDMLALLFPDKK